jgi:hypothetical protein
LPVPAEPLQPSVMINNRGAASLRMVATLSRVRR